MIRFIFILIALPTWLLSQTPTWNLINLEDEVDVTQMQIDSFGFLWLSDQHRLYRFDGKRIVAKFELEEEKISDFIFNGDDILIGTSYGRLLKVNLYNSHYQVLRDTTLNEAVTKILYLDESQYVIGSYGAGLEIVEKDIKHKIDTDNGLVSNEVYDISYFNSKYYIATDQGVQIFHPENIENNSLTLGLKDGLSDLVVTHLLIFENKLWYTDYNGHLGNISKNHEIVNYPLESKVKINDLTKGSQGIYLATDQGLKKFYNGKIVNQYPIDKTEKISNSLKDNEGNLWLINSKGNLLKGNIHFQKMDTQFSEIRAIGKIEQTFLVGNKHGLYTYKADETKKINANNITHLATLNNYLFVGTFSQGVMVYDSDLNLVDHVKDWQGYKDQSVLHISCYDNQIYVSSLSGLMEFNFSNGQLVASKSFNEVIEPGYIYCIFKSGDKLYLGTDRKGFIVLDLKLNEVKYFTIFDSGEKIKSVYAIIKDKEGKIWFTSKEKGLGYLFNESPVALTKIKNTTDQYTSLALTKNGNLLAVRSATVDLIDPINYQVKNFEKEQDVDEKVSYLNTIYTDSEQIYFVQNHDIYTYSSDTNIKIFPEVVIDEVLVNLISVPNQFTFDENENNIEFKYVGSWLTDPSKLSYQYKLEGFDNDWRNTRDNSVSYNKLTPGQYEFRLRASANGEFDGSKAVVHGFEIKRFFYNRWWVRTLGLIFLGLVGWKINSANENRKKQKLALEKLNIENQFINLKNQLNPHFLFNSFNTLIGMIEEDSDSSVAFVEGMTDFYRNMLELGKHNMITLSQENEMLSQYIAILVARFRNQLDINVSIDESSENYLLPPMTLQLLLENAVKHNVVSTKNPLKVKIKQKENTVSVCNQKTSIVKNVLSTKTGLENLKRRFELINMKAPEIKNTDEFFEVIVHLKDKNNESSNS